MRQQGDCRRQTDHAQEAGLVKFALQDRFLEIAEKPACVAADPAACQFEGAIKDARLERAWDLVQEASSYSFSCGAYFGEPVHAGVP
jgi:hypothetical protein